MESVRLHQGQHRRRSSGAQRRPEGPQFAVKAIQVEPSVALLQSPVDKLIVHRQDGATVASELRSAKQIVQCDRTVARPRSVVAWHGPTVARHRDATGVVDKEVEWLLG